MNRTSNELRDHKYFRAQKKPVQISEPAFPEKSGNNLNYLVKVIFLTSIKLDPSAPVASSL